VANILPVLPIPDCTSSTISIIPCRSQILRSSFKHYKEINYAIVIDECHLAFVLIKQNKRAEFEEHYQICKQEWGNYPPDPANPNPILDLIEEVLAAGKGKGYE
jgi:hypothetical protein